MPQATARPILLVPWDKDFIDAVAGRLVAATGGDFADVTVIFPLRRAGRFLVDRLAAHPGLARPCLLPEIAAVDQWLAGLGRAGHGRPLRLLDVLGRVGLLHAVIQDLQNGSGEVPWIGERVFPAELHRFYPWGLRLAELCEELFRHGVAAANIAHAAAEVLPQAAAILENLKAIHGTYRRRLLSGGAATPGLCQSLAAGDPGAAAARLEGRRLFACGFFAPSGCEETVFRALYAAGRLEFLCHGDPLLATDPDRAHFSCRELTALARRLGAAVRLFGQDMPSRPATGRRKPGGPAQHSLFSGADAAPATASELLAAKTIRFYEGYDLHSQLAALGRELEAAPDTADAAVVLPDTGLLMPVLHQLPRRDVNITMGYPLSRSSVGRLIETILRLQETRLGPGRYAWREVVALLRHPYLKMLKLEGREPLRPLFAEWERQVRQGGRFLDPLALETGPDPDAGPAGPLAAEAPDVPGDGPDRRAVAALARRVLEACLTAFESVATPRRLGDALAGLAGLLLDEAHAGDIWERFLIDAECLFRVTSGVIPALRGGDLADEPFPPRTLFTILRGLIDAERAAFEAEPLSGLQIMGMLETRLLSFSRIYILDAVEDRLPGVAPHDPLLPDPLRHLLGLSDTRQRDMVAAYTFYRLIMGASEVVVFYRAGVQGGGLFDDKPMRSRFVDQLLWEMEKRRGGIIKPGQPPLHTVSLPLRPIPPRDAGVDKTPAVRAALEAILAREVSPSLLDAYLTCPLRFCHARIMRLSPLDEVAEEGDPAKLGSLTHRVLHHALAPFLNREIDGAALDGEALAAGFLAELDAAPFYHALPPDGRLFLAHTGRERLRRFVSNMPRTTPLALETKLIACLPAAGRTWTFSGTVDRVDRRASGVVILDYKTGSPRKPGAALWEDDAFFDRLASPEAVLDEGLLAGMLERVQSVQLPLYGLLYAAARGETPFEAACVELRRSGEECGLFGETVSPGVRRAAFLERTPVLVDYLLRHMTQTPRFLPQPSRACDWCEFRGMCGGGAADAS